MRIYKSWMAALVLVMQLGMSGCSMIVFFPQKAAEKAADKVLDDILPGDSAQETAAKPSEPKQP